MNPAFCLHVDRKPLKFVPRLGAAGPWEFVPECAGKDLVDGALVALAPGDGDPRVHVVDLAGPERNRLVVVLVLHVLVGELSCQHGAIQGKRSDADLHNWW